MARAVTCGRRPRNGGDLPPGGYSCRPRALSLETAIAAGVAGNLAGRGHRVVWADEPLGAANAISSTTLEACCSELRIIEKTGLHLVFEGVRIFGRGAPRVLARAAPGYELVRSRLATGEDGMTGGDTAPTGSSLAHTGSPGR